MSQCVRCFVSGRVQGVFFRASARDEASRLGLSGFVRNLRDGRVEVVACGDDAGLEQMQAWLSEGPPQAVVTGRECEAAEDPGYEDFRVL